AGQNSLQAADDEIEIIIRADCELTHPAALRGVRIDVREMLEARRVSQIPEQRETVSPRLTILRGRRREPEVERRERRRGQRETRSTDDGSASWIHLWLP